jgi:hypothetical protein
MIETAAGGSDVLFLFSQCELGILETTHRTSRRYEQHPRVRIRSSFRAVCAPRTRER